MCTDILYDDLVSDLAFIFLIKRFKYSYGWNN